MISRRRFLLGSGALGAVTALRGHDVVAGSARGPQIHRFTVTATRIGEYLYVPFDVAPGATRIDVAVRRHPPAGAATGVGLFDHRGADYQSAGFRGVYGEERTDFYVTATRASDSFIPGPIRAGRWTVVIPVFTVTVPTTVEVRVKVSFDPQPPAGGLRIMGPEQGVVRDEPGWYRGDLHCHTFHSSDAWNTSAEHRLSPRRWAQLAAAAGMHFVALTDHNVVTQNFHLAGDAAGTGVLLLPGEEMTNWFHGHATVSGLAAPDAWLDWRQRPVGIPLQEGHTESRITAFVAAVAEQGAYAAAAHPFGAHLTWQFLAEMQATPAARPHGFEVWTAQWQPDDEAALAAWDTMLQRGIRITANGGSDLHRTSPDVLGAEFGTPTTVVFAEQLSKRGLVHALKRGRCFVTRRPDGHEVTAWARRAGEGEGGWRMMGDTLEVDSSDTVEVMADVRVGAVEASEALRVVLWANGAPVTVVPLDPAVARQRVTARLPAVGGYVRAEVRDRPVPRSDPARTTAGRLDMEAFSNPVWISTMAS